MTGKAISSAIDAGADVPMDDAACPQLKGGQVFCPDPSEYRPEPKHKDAFRSYDEGENSKECVKRTYKLMHTHQTVEYGREQRAKWLNFDHVEMTIMDALDLLNQVVDESDPDTDLPNIVHAFQTAERIRADHPDKEWFQLTGLVHDLGKIMALYGQPQWSTVGDTFVVGCKPADAIVFSADTFDECPDREHPVYSTELGMYEEGCGLDKILFSWGHDEYLYQVLKNHGCTLPDEAMYAIRFHSFYPWHTGGAYKRFESEQDKKMLDWVLEFNKYDLYSKSDNMPDIDKLRPYYQSLIDKYMPGLVKF